MRLSKAEIINFRSIENVTVDFDMSCKVMVGVNEAGKSNILRAIALIDKNRAIVPSDIREVRHDEPEVSKAEINLSFKVEAKDIAPIYQRVTTQLCFAPDTDPLVLVTQDTRRTLSECINTTSVLLEIDLLKATRRVMSWAVKGTMPCSGWFKPAASMPDDVIVTNSEGIQLPAKSFALLHESATTAISSTYLTPAENLDAHEQLMNAMRGHLSANWPICVYWEFSPDQLLPASMDISTFAGNPKTCPALKNLFEIAGHRDIQQAIAKARKKPNGLPNLLHRVGNAATEHIRSVWSELKGLSISLQQNGDRIDCSIKDSFNMYDMVRRSDGFKRIVTFAILISARVKTAELEGAVLLFDEPDACLHPSGCRLLKDELIRISAKNTVVYATHSIFMIDRDHIDRHMLISRSNETTNAHTAGPSLVADEEVLLRALGTSIFESISPTNLIFEGWKDKRLFQVAISSNDSLSAHYRDSLRQVGTCHSDGAKHINYTSSMIELGRRKALIVSDSDAPSKEHRSKYRGPFKWLTYEDLTDSANFQTSEDFLNPDFVTRIVNEAVPSADPSQTFRMPKAHRGTIAEIQRWLRARGGANESHKDELLQIKNSLVASLTEGDIVPEYFKLCECLDALLSEEVATKDSHIKT